MRAEAISPEQAKQVAAQFMTARYEKAATPGLAAVFILHFCRIFAAIIVFFFYLLQIYLRMSSEKCSNFACKIEIVSHRDV